MARSSDLTRHLAASNGHGRIDKRKSRRPTRSLSLAEAHPEFCTLRMQYLDDYQRNPCAYSRALVGAPAPRVATRYSAPPQNPPNSSSPKHLPSLAPSTPPAAAPPLLPQEAAGSVQVVRRDVSATLRRLFPTLDDPDICKTAAAQAAPKHPAPRLQQLPAPHQDTPNSNPGPATLCGSDELANEIYQLQPRVASCSVRWPKGKNRN
ncbi:hypothetical protein GGF46_001773 [Coemansia sp. RSA 552]|nr:hypothetical protein GGF46_001773 [Coemansia sp. RSA 552]